MCLGALEQIELAFKLCGFHLLEVFFETLQTLLNLPKIVHYQIEIDVFCVAQRIYFANVWNGRLIERPQHVNQRVDRPQIICVCRLLQRFLANGSYIGVFNGGVHQLFGIVERR